MQMSTWLPEADAKNYYGHPIPSDWDFFVAPPPEIGTVIGAQSSLTAGVEPGPVTRHRVRCTALGVGIVALVWFLFYFADWKPEQLPGFYMTGVVSATVFAIIIWLCAKPSYVCSYVGAQGVAYFACYGRRDHLVRSEVFRFEDATELRTKLRSIYVNFAYLHTHYVYVWTDSNHRVRYKLAGRHYAKNGLPQNQQESYVFARVAEVAWTNHLMERNIASIHEGGVVEFNAGRKRRVSVGYDFLEISGERFEHGDIDVAVHRGIITFKRTRPRPGLFGRKTICSVAYGDFANVRAFLALLEDCLDISLGTIAVASEHGYHLIHFVGR